MNRSVDNFTRQSFNKSERFGKFQSPGREVQQSEFKDSEEVNGLLIDAIRAKLALLSKLQ